MNFKEKVLQVVTDIPKGETRSYKEIATVAGSPNASRAVGNIMKNNNNPHVPCHRVIRSDGKLGEYNGIGGVKTKLEILKREGTI